MLGCGGGIALARSAEEIRIGNVVRHGEPDLDLAECGICLIAPACGLTGALARALAAFVAVLDGYSLADISSRRSDLTMLLGLESDGLAL